MKYLVLLAFLTLASCHINKPFITKEHVEEIKKTATFKTYDFEDHPFKYWSQSDIRSLLGTIIPKNTPTEIDLGENCDAPESFDSRTQWPSYIHPIRNQMHCGSCWAFAATEVLSDRFAIATNGQINTVLSPQDLVSCDHSDMGCNGGYLDNSWRYLVNEGVVSDECLPYTSGEGDSGFCPIDFMFGKCPNGKTYHKFHASNYQNFSNNCDIKKSIMAEGPVETGFNVFSDFMSYQSGVYVSNCSDNLGGHAVKIVGWGREFGREYWIIANSWGTSWGESGFVRVATGQECLNLDTQCYAGSANVSKLMKEAFE